MSLRDQEFFAENMKDLDDPLKSILLEDELFCRFFFESYRYNILYFYYWEQPENPEVHAKCRVIGIFTPLYDSVKFNKSGNLVLDVLCDHFSDPGVVDREIRKNLRLVADEIQCERDTAYAN